METEFSLASMTSVYIPRLPDLSPGCRGSPARCWTKEGRSRRSPRYRSSPATATSQPLQRSTRPPTFRVGCASLLHTGYPMARRAPTLCCSSSKLRRRQIPPIDAATRSRADSTGAGKSSPTEPHAEYLCTKDAEVIASVDLGSLVPCRSRSLLPGGPVALRLGGTVDGV